MYLIQLYIYNSIPLLYIFKRNINILDISPLYILQWYYIVKYSCKIFERNIHILESVIYLLAFQGPSIKDVRPMGGRAALNRSMNDHGRTGGGRFQNRTSTSEYFEQIRAGRMGVVYQTGDVRQGGGSKKSSFC